MEARDERGRDTPPRPRTPGTCAAHVDALAAKAYWAAFDHTPEFVVLFVPADPFLDAALQRDPTLLEHAFARNVVLATPATLVALLRTVAYSWRQEALARNAVAVHALARELYGRLSTLGDHVGKLGTSLGGRGHGVQPGGRVAGVAGAGQRPQARRAGGLRPRSWPRRRRSRWRPVSRRPRSFSETLRPGRRAVGRHWTDGRYLSSPM